MEQKFNQFFTQYNNKSVEVSDSGALNQCMDLLYMYVQFLQIPIETVKRPYAFQVWTLASAVTKKYFDIVPNTPTYLPPVGAIAVFGKDGDTVSAGKISGIPVGHVSMVAPGTNMMDLVSFDQNWDTQHYYRHDSQGNRVPYSRIVIHRRYYGVIGFLVPKNQSIGDDVFVNKAKAILDSPVSPYEKRKQITALVMS